MNEAAAELVTIRRKAEAVLTYAISGAAEQKIRYGTYGREALYRPVEARVSCRMVDNVMGTSIRMVFDSVWVIGKRLKKDGTLGLVEVSEFYQVERMDGAPQWVIDLAARAARDMEDADTAWGQAS